MIKDAISLALNQSADKGECGSCKFFVRENGEGVRGRCMFRLPPTRVYAKQVWDAESAPLDSVRDTDGCNFWQSTGATYIVSRVIRP
jgi:hypothetical protein